MVSDKIVTVTEKIRPNVEIEVLNEDLLKYIKLAKIVISSVC